MQPVLLVEANDLLENIRRMIREELDKAQSAKTPKFYTIKEACDLLRISKSTFHRWCGLGKLSPIKEGGVVILSEDEIEKIRSSKTRR